MEKKENNVETYFDKRTDFELFKSNVCHRLKELGDAEFIIEVLEKDEIRKYYEKSCYIESLYLLAMLDYISRENNVPICSKYDEMRKMKLKNTVFPAGVLTIAAVTKNEKIKEQAIKDSIPEFIKFNIVESEVRNVV